MTIDKAAAAITKDAVKPSSVCNEDAIPENNGKAVLPSILEPIKQGYIRDR